MLSGVSSAATTVSSFYSATATTPSLSQQSTAVASSAPAESSVAASQSSGASRRRRRADPQDITNLSEVVGTAWGHLVRDYYAATPEEFLRLVVEPPQPLLPLVSSLAHARVPLRNRGRGNILEQLMEAAPVRRASQSSTDRDGDEMAEDEDSQDTAALTQVSDTPAPKEGTDGGGVVVRRAPDSPTTPTLSRSGRTLLMQAWTVYRVYRLSACPNALQPTVEDEDVPVRFTRAAARYLRPSGLRPSVDLSQAVTRRAVANDRLRELWEAVRSSGAAVVWYDNFYKRKYMRTPARMDVSLNCVVAALLVLPHHRDQAVGMPSVPGPERSGAHEGDDRSVPWGV